MKTLFRPALVLFVVLTFITGVAYPLLVTGAAQTLFPSQSHGSLILQNGTVVGSDLIGQNFSDPKNFWGRPSATSPMPYNAAASGGSNLGPLNPALTDAVKARVAALRAVEPNNLAPVPVDLVTASASGLDPHISPAAARFQINRVAKARGLAVEKVQTLVLQQTLQPLFGLLGEPQVNVLKLNMALASLKQD